MAREAFIWLRVVREQVRAGDVKIVERERASVSVEAEPLLGDDQLDWATPLCGRAARGNTRRNVGFLGQYRRYRRADPRRGSRCAPCRNRACYP